MLYDTNPFSLWFCVAFGYYLYAMYVMHMTFTYKMAGWKVSWWPVVPVPVFAAFFSFTAAKHLKTCRKDILDPTDVTVSDVCLDDIDLALDPISMGQSLKQPLLELKQSSKYQPVREE